MLKKMRRRFVAAAMAAITAVVLLLLCAVNLWNYRLTTSQQDDTLEMLMKFDEGGVWPSYSGGFRVDGPFGRFSVEMQYMLRFFIVHCTPDGRMQGFNQDYIASISAEDAAKYASEVISSGRERGYYRGYRFLTGGTVQGTTAIFLNSEREIQSMKGVLLASGGVAIISLAAVFALLCALSRRAIAPYVRNIETQKRFITDAGHELKTPLTSISTSAEILALENGGDEWVQNIQKQCARLSKLISNLVTLSRLDEERPFPEKTDFSLSDAVWEASEPFSSLARAKGKRFLQNIEDGVFVSGDKNAVQQMVSILLDNAVKYSDENGEISILLCKKQKKAEISVFNTCVLEDDEPVKRLFDRFYRPDKSRAKETGGTGIGLSIAKATAEAHGGSIKAEKCNGGLKITVLL